jgi:hypothetical protein
MTKKTLTKTERLTAALLADRHRETTRHSIVKCWSCGHGYTYRRGELNGNFCSVRCQDWYDAGNPGLAQEWLKPKIDWHSITGWRVMAGPIEIGSDYYAPLRHAFEHRMPKAKAKRSTIPNYTIKADGHGYWQPSAASRALGFRSIAALIVPKPAPRRRSLTRHPAQPERRDRSAKIPIARPHKTWVS